MCLEFFLGTDKTLAVEGLTRLTLEMSGPYYPDEVPGLEGLHITYVGVDGSCSCSIPHVIAEEPIPYFDGMFSPDDVAENTPVAAELLRLLARALTQSEVVRFYAANRANGEFSQPKGIVTLNLGAQPPEELVLTENFLYAVTA